MAAWFGKKKGKSGDIPENEYFENNDTNRAAMSSMKQNKEVQQAGKDAMKDEGIRKAGFAAFMKGGKDPNANKQLAGKLARNKAVQGAAVSVAKDEKVQKAAWGAFKKHATKDNLGKMASFMGKAASASSSSNKKK